MLLCALLPLGCNRKDVKQTDEKVPVIVSPAVTRQILDHEDFTGRVEAMERINLRARVTGYLNKVDFKEGAKVDKETLLFEIDPKSYKAGFDHAEAKVNEANKRVRHLKADYDRAKLQKATGSISREEYDKHEGNYNEAVAAVDVAVQSRNIAKINLDWTKVYSPIDGVTSRALIDKGNLVMADATILTTIVSVDPIYAYFDVDERTDLRLERLIREGKIKSSKDKHSKVKVFLALADEDDFKDHIGDVDFVENVLEPTTGTKRYRAVFANPSGLLSPGQFVRIRFPVGVPHTAVVIPEIAIGSDQGQKFVYVVGADNEVSYRKIKIGQQLKTYRVVEGGLQAGEKVVRSGLQRIRPRTKVDAKIEEIPAGDAVSQLPALMSPQLSSAPAASVNKSAAP